MSEQEYDSPPESTPLYTTSLDGLPRTLTVRHLAALLHYASGTPGDVSLHPRGCGVCEKAVEVAGMLGLDMFPLYVDELPTEVVGFTDHLGGRHEWNWRTGQWERVAPAPEGGFGA